MKEWARRNQRVRCLHNISFQVLTKPFFILQSVASITSRRPTTSLPTRTHPLTMTMILSQMCRLRAHRATSPGGGTSTTLPPPIGTTNTSVHMCIVCLQTMTPTHTNVNHHRVRVRVGHDLLLYRTGLRSSAVIRRAVSEVCCSARRSAPVSCNHIYAYIPSYTDESLLLSSLIDLYECSTFGARRVEIEGGLARNLPRKVHAALVRSRSRKVGRLVVDGIHKPRARHRFHRTIRQESC